MENTVQRAAQKLLCQYQTLHQVEECTHPDLPMIAKGAYVSRRQTVVLTSKRRDFGRDTYEYTVFFACHKPISAAELRHCISVALGEGLAQASLLEQNTVICVTASFLLKKIDKNAGRLLSSAKFHKAFQRPVRGELLLRTAALDCSTGKVYCNGQGKRLKGLYQRVWRECKKEEMRALRQKEQAGAQVPLDK